MQAGSITIIPPTAQLIGAALCLCAAISGCSSSASKLPVPAEVITKRIQPSNDRNWRPEMSKLAWVESDGEFVKIHNIRNNQYVTENDFVPEYYDRTIRLSQIQSVDYIVVPFPSQPNLAHTMLSFGIADGTYVTVSAEVRKEVGEDYSVIKGLGREYELMYVVGDEKDLVGLRAAHRQNDVYVYPTVASAEQAQQLFTSVMTRTNQLAAKPEFYNTLTNNCTTNIRRHVNELQPNRIANAWQVLLPGHSDKYAYDLGLLDQRVPFEDLKAASLVNQLVVENYDAKDFSEKIRAGRTTIDRIARQERRLEPIINGRGSQFLQQSR